MLEIIRKTLISFCLNFIRNPYLCYTEHGQHALFYTMLYNALPEQQRYVIWQNQKVCVIQKEYPTSGNLGKSKRQHWDVAVVKAPPMSHYDSLGSYDFLKLGAVVEFGLNESEEHLRDDLARLCHKDSNIEQGFIVHLVRISESETRFSRRDLPSYSPKIFTPKRIKALTVGNSIEIYLALADITSTYESGAWHICDGAVTRIIRGQ